MTCKTCGGRRVVTYIADTCNPQRQGDCPSCVGIRIAGGDAGAVERQAVEAMRRSRQAWSNVLEFSLIAESHRDATEALIDQLDEAIAALALPAALSEGRSHG